MSLHSIQEEILLIVGKNDVETVNENFLSEALQLKKDVIRYHLNLLTKENFLESAIEIDNCGYEEHLCIKLRAKGRIYIENPNNLDSSREVLYLQSNNKYEADLEQKSRLIINCFLDKGLSSYEEIADSLKIDSDYVRGYLLEMKRFGLVELCNLKTPNASYCIIKDIKFKGKRLIEGFNLRDMNPNANLRNNNFHDQRTYINQSHKGTGNNVVGDRNISNITINSDFEDISSKIQKLLDQQAEEFNPTTEKGQQRITTETIQEIENNPNLAQRILSASEKGLIEYMKARFIAPVQSAFLAVLEDWYQTRSQK